MTKRFGRNQRRAMRQRIADLEREAMRFGIPAPAGAPCLEEYGVVAWETRVGEDQYQRQISAEVTVLQFDRQLVDAKRVSFQGRSYWLATLNSPVAEWGEQFGRYTVELIGEGAG